MDETRSDKLLPAPSAPPAPPTSDKVPGGQTLDTGHDLRPAAPIEMLTPREIPPKPKATRDTAAISTGLTPGEHREFPEVPGYEILGILGHGGMGVVYRARQLKANRVVALKMIRAVEHASAQDHMRFQIETEAVARLQHPNIVQLHDVGEIGGQPFFSLELCAGGALDTRLKTWQPTPRESAELIETLARAMHYAHLRGVVHRDLKPANVLLSFSRETPASADAALAERSRLNDVVPKITDFGLAKRTDESARDISQSGAIMGTPAYMAPEQAEGKVHDTGPAADVYALGALLYTCLTQRPPFVGTTTIETLRQVLNDEPPPPSRLVPNVPRDLETICLKCLAKEPARRYASAEALAEDLRRFQTGEPIQARPVSKLERGVKWVKRNRGLSAGIAAAVLALLVGTAVSTWQAIAASKAAASEARQRQTAEEEKTRADAARQTAENEKQSADAARLTAENEKKSADAARLTAVEEKKGADAARKTAEQQRDRSELLVYAGKLSLAQSAFQEGNGVLALQYLDECQWNLRGWEHRHLWTSFNSKQTFLGHTDGVNSVAFSANGKRIVSGSSDKTVKVWDADKGQEVFTLMGHTDKVRSVAYSADGKRIVSGSVDKTVKVWDAVKGKEIFTLKGHTGGVSSVAFSVDGKRIVSGSGRGALNEQEHPAQGEVKVWDADKGKEIRTLDRFSNGVASMALSTDGKRIVTGNDFGKGMVTVRNVDTGQEVLTLKGHKAGVTSVAFSADGQRIVSGSWDGTVKVWDTDKVQEILSLEGHTRTVTSVAFSADGKRIVSGSLDGTIKVWDTDKGQEMFTLIGHTGLVTCVAFSADDRSIVSSSDGLHAQGRPLPGEVKVWDADKGQEVLTLRDSDGATSVAYSADGKRIVSGDWKRSIKVWDVEKRQLLLTLKEGHTEQITSLAISADGKRIVSGSIDRTVKVWDAEKGKEVFTLKGHTGWVLSVAFSVDGKRIVSGSGGFDVPSQPAKGEVKVWDADTGQEIITLKGHTGSVASVAISADGKRIVSDNGDKTVKVWDADTGQEILILKGHTGEVLSVAFSADGKRIISGSMDKTAKVWDADTGQEIFTLKGHTNGVVSVAFSVDGKRIVSGSGDKTVKVWDAAKGQEVLTLKGHLQSVLSVAFSVDGKRIVSGSGEQSEPGVVKIWDADKSQEVFTLKGHASYVTSVVFSAEGKLLVSGGGGLDEQGKPLPGEVKLWDMDKGQEVFTLKGITKGVTDVGFSPDGKRLIAQDESGEVRAWDAVSGQPIVPCTDPAPKSDRTALRPDGSLRTTTDGAFIRVVRTGDQRP